MLQFGSIFCTYVEVPRYLLYLSKILYNPNTHHCLDAVNNMPYGIGRVQINFDINRCTVGRVSPRGLCDGAQWASQMYIPMQELCTSAQPESPEVGWSPTNKEIASRNCRGYPALPRLICSVHPSVSPSVRYHLRLWSCHKWLVMVILFLCVKNHKGS